MLLNALVLSLSITPLVAAHGKVLSVTGDAGGNGTALGIKGGVVPASGPNSKVTFPLPQPCHLKMTKA